MIPAVVGMLAAVAHHKTAFIIVFAAFVVLSLVLIAYVVRFAVQLGRARRAAAAAAAAARSASRRHPKP
jgi:hypothetical protein